MLGAQLLVAAQVLIPRSWDRAPCRALCSAGSLLRLSPPPSLLAYAHAHSLSRINKKISLKIFKVKIKIKMRRPRPLTSQRPSRYMQVHGLLIPDVDLFHKKSRRSGFLGEPGREDKAPVSSRVLLSPLKDLHQTLCAKIPLTTRTQVGTQLRSLHSTTGHHPSWRRRIKTSE